MAEQTNTPVGSRRYGPLFFLIALAAVSLLLHATRHFRGREIAARQKQYAELVRSRPVEDIKAKRARFYQSRYFLGYPTAVSHAAADLVRRFSAMAPPLRLLAVQVDPGLHDMGFKLTVEVAHVGPGEVRRRLAAYLDRLRQVPAITQADLSGSGPTARGRGVRVFAVNGRAELQP